MNNPRSCTSRIQKHINHQVVSQEEEDTNSSQATPHVSESRQFGVNLSKNNSGTKITTSLRHLYISVMFFTSSMLLILPVPRDMPSGVSHAAGLTLFAICCWSTGLLPEYVTALVFFALAMLVSVAPPDVVFSGFHSGALWLIFSGLITGEAIKRSGLGTRLAYILVKRLGHSYFGLISGIVLLSLVLIFIMPSTIGRVLLLTPILVLLAERLGFAAGSPGRNGMILAMATTSYICAAGVLPANVSNMILAGSAETLHGITFTYGRYLLLHMPVSGLLNALVITAVVTLLFYDEPHATDTSTPLNILSIEERWIAFIILASLGLWMTDVLHQIPPAWIALGAAVFCLLPVVNLVPPDVVKSQINLPLLFYIAGILGMGAVVSSSGLGQIIGRMLLSLVDLEPGKDGLIFATMVGIATITGLFTTMPGIPAVLTSFAPEISAATDIPLITLLMTQVISFSAVILPYQAAPVVLAMQIGGVPLVAGTRLLIVLSVITLLILTPLNYLWWQWLGYFS